MSEAWGSFAVKLDDKGRIFLPAKARNLMAAGTHLTKGQDGCLFLFSPDQFTHYLDNRREQVPPNLPPLALDRVLFHSVVTQDPDKQGRISVPAQLRKYAGLDREGMVIGLEDRMELWDVGRWEAYLETYEKVFAAMDQGSP